MEDLLSCKKANESSGLVPAVELFWFLVRVTWEPSCQLTAVGGGLALPLTELAAVQLHSLGLDGVVHRMGTILSGG